MDEKERGSVWANAEEPSHSGGTIIGTHKWT